MAHERKSGADRKLTSRAFDRHRNHIRTSLTESCFGLSICIDQERINLKLAWLEDALEVRHQLGLVFQIFEAALSNRSFEIKNSDAWSCYYVDHLAELILDHSDLLCQLGEKAINIGYPEYINWEKIRNIMLQNLNKPHNSSQDISSSMMLTSSNSKVAQILDKYSLGSALHQYVQQAM